MYQVMETKRRKAMADLVAVNQYYYKSQVSDKAKTKKARASNVIKYILLSLVVIF